tara:strand:- start:308 stop:475 length:168 start_codon:yes stop_codon:yes gene_type:complete
MMSDIGIKRERQKAVKLCGSIVAIYKYPERPNRKIRTAAKAKGFIAGFLLFNFWG